MSSVPDGVMGDVVASVSGRECEDATCESGRGKMSTFQVEVEAWSVWRRHDWIQLITKGLVKIHMNGRV